MGALTGEVNWRAEIDSNDHWTWWRFHCTYPGCGTVDLWVSTRAAMEARAEGHVRQHGETPSEGDPWVAGEGGTNG